jgi:hypothetical protein
MWRIIWSLVTCIGLSLFLRLAYQSNALEFESFIIVHQSQILNSVIWRSYGSRPQIERLCALLSLRALQANCICICIPESWEKNQLKQGKQAKQRILFHHTAQPQSRYQPTTFITHSINSASSFTPSASSKSSLILSKSTFATHGGNAFPICFFT